MSFTQVRHARIGRALRHERLLVLTQARAGGCIIDATRLVLDECHAEADARAGCLWADFAETVAEGECGTQTRHRVRHTAEQSPTLHCSFTTIET